MIISHHLHYQVGNEATLKKSAACMSSKSFMQEQNITCFIGKGVRFLNDKSLLKQIKNSVINLSRRNAFGTSSDLDAQSLTFQESLRLAVLAEVEVRLMDARAHLISFFNHVSLLCVCVMLPFG